MIAGLSIWTTVYVVVAMGACIVGRPSVWVPIALTFNLLFCVAVGGAYLPVAAVDLLCACILLGRGRRESLVGLIYCAMVPISILAKLFSWPLSTTYAIIEALAYIQCFVIGSGHVGNHDNARASNMRLLSALDRLADWRNAAFASAVSGWGKRR